MQAKSMGVFVGQDAQEILDLIYPPGQTDGSDKTRKAALKRLIELGKEKPALLVDLPKGGFSGSYEQGNYIMRWNYAYRWVALYRTVKELAST